MARGRTPEIGNLDARAARLERSINKHRRLIEEQETELADVRSKLDSFSSPEFLDAKKALVEKKKAELQKLLANIAKMEENLSD
jgi:chromosome segregation ATPase